MALYIAKHNGLRSVVRVVLAPLVGFSWLTMKFGMIFALVVFLSMLSLIIGGTCFVFKTRKANL